MPPKNDGPRGPIDDVHLSGREEAERALGGPIDWELAAELGLRATAARERIDRLLSASQ
jgi:hypothetical protein